MYACPSNRRARKFHRQSSPSSRASSRAVVVIVRSIVRSFDPKSPRRAPSLSRVFRAHRFVRAPERGSTRVNTASRDDARSLTSDHGGCGEHGASLEKCASSSEARARQTTTRASSPSTVDATEERASTVERRSTVDGGRRESLARDDRRRRVSIRIHSFFHSFIRLSTLPTTPTVGGRRRLMSGNAGARFIALGVPFVAFVAIGSVGLGRLVAGRLEVRDALTAVEDTRAPATTQRRRRAKAKFDVEAEKRRLIESNTESVETYEMRPVWRPGEGGGGARDARERER